MRKVLAFLAALLVSPALAETTFPPGGSGSSSITIGTTPISGGTSGNILFHNGSSIGENTTTGTGAVALQTSPSLITPYLSMPYVYAGTGVVIAQSVPGTPPAFSFVNTDGTNGAGTSLIFLNNNSVGTQKTAAYINPGLYSATAGSEQGIIDYSVYQGSTGTQRILAQLCLNSSCSFAPSDDNYYSLGLSGFRWSNVYAVAGNFGNASATGAVSVGLLGSGNGLTANAPSLDIHQRMNNAAVAFTLARLNFEDQASSATSQYLQIQQSGSAVAGFQKPPATTTNAGTIFYIGSAPGSTLDPAISITRPVATGGSGNAHGIGDTTPINRSGTIAYASYDSQVSFNGVYSYDHFAAFQSRPIYQQTGTITNHYGLYDSVSISGTATLTNRYSAYIADAQGAGVVVNQYGLYVAALAAGTTANYGVYIAGNNPSYFGGGVQIATTTMLTSTVAMSNGAAAASGTLTNAPTAGNPTKWIPINDNGTTRYIPAW